MLPLRLTISLGVIGTTKDCTRSKGVPKFSPELYSESWVSIMDHIVRQAKLSDNTLEKNCATCLAFNSPAPKVHVVKTVYFVKRLIQVKMALQPLTQDGNPVVKSIDQDPNLFAAMGNGYSNPGGACMLTLAC